MFESRVKTSIIITLYNDKRIRRLLPTLLAQTLPADEIIFADGGSSDGTYELAKQFEAEHESVRTILAPGNIAKTRNQVIPLCKGDIIVFFDADEMAPRHWLESLTAPIREGKADFTGGPTRPLAEAKSKVEDYVNKYEAWFYENIVSQDITMLPMGNSAWHKRVFQRIGVLGKDLHWEGKRWGGEDYDVNIMADQAGFRGVYVPNAWLYHDQSNLNSFRIILGKKYRYNVGAAIVYMKNGALRDKLGGATKPMTSFEHPYELLDFLIKPVALFRAIIAYNVGW
jgi:glycosyltransferase involved in cell wall biosynthesis